MGILSSLIGPKPPAPVQPAEVAPQDPYDISKLTSQQWQELYQLPHLQEMQQRFYPGQNRWDHPELDQAVTQAAVNRVREQMSMNTLKTSSHQGARAALANFGVKTSAPFFNPEEAEEYENSGTYAPAVGAVSSMIGGLGHHFAGGSQLGSIGLMNLLNAIGHSGMAAYEAPEGEGLSHAAGTLGGIGKGMALGGGVGAGTGAGLGALGGALFGALKHKSLAGAGMGALGGGVGGGVLGGLLGGTVGGAHGGDKGHYDAQQKSKAKAAPAAGAPQAAAPKPAAPAVGGGKPGRDGDGDGKKNEANKKPVGGGKPGRDGDGDGKKNEAKKKAKKDGEKKAFEVFFGKSAGFDLWNPATGAVTGAEGGTRGSNLGMATGAGVPVGPKRQFTMADLMQAKQQMSQAGVPAGGLRAARPLAPRLPMKLGGVDAALENFGLQKEAWAPLLAMGARLAPMAARFAPMLGRAATAVRGALPGLGKELGTQLAVGGAMNMMTPTPKQEPQMGRGPMGGFGG